MSVSPTPSHATDTASISLDQVIASFKQAEKIGVDEQTFEKRATPIDTPQAIDNFIDGSRQTLNHLKLAALSQILEARSRNKNITDRENYLHHEWMEAARDFTQRINYDIISKPISEAIARLTPRVGILTSAETYGIGKVVREASRRTMGGPGFLLPCYPCLKSGLTAPCTSTALY